jgi:hypothetical protein
VTADPEYGPFLSSERHAHNRRAERALYQQFNEIVADLEPQERTPCLEPSFPRAVLSAVWEILAAIVRRS